VRADIYKRPYSFKREPQRSRERVLAGVICISVPLFCIFRASDGGVLPLLLFVFFIAKIDGTTTTNHRWRAFTLNPGAHACEIHANNNNDLMTYRGVYRNFSPK